MNKSLEKREEKRPAREEKVKSTVREEWRRIRSP